MLAVTAVTESYVTPDGNTPTGSVSFVLNEPIVDGSGETVSPKKIVAGLSAGAIVAFLFADDSAGIVPAAGSMYWVTEAIDGAPDRSYWITVPAAPPGSRSVADLVATQGLPTVSSATAAWASPADVGRYIASPLFPAGTKIASVQSSTNATLSLPAAASGSGQPCVIGAQVALGALQN